MDRLDHAKEKRRSSTVVDELSNDHRSTCEVVVPWFFSNMQPAYFSHMGVTAQRQHLRAIVAVQASQSLEVPDITLSTPDPNSNGVQYTYIVAGAQADQPARRQIDRLPKGVLTRVLLTSSRDEKLSLNVFDVTPTSAEVSAGPGDGLRRFVIGEGASQAEVDALALHTEYQQKLEAGELSTHAGTPTKRTGAVLKRSDLELRKFLSRCSSTYVTTQKPRLLVKQRRLYEEVRGGDDAAVEMETEDQGSRDWSHDTEACTLLTIALPGVEQRAALRRMLDLLELHRMSLHLAQVDTVDDPEGDGFVTLLRTVIKPDKGRVPPTEAGWEQLKREACRLKWIDDPALTLTLAVRGAGAAEEPHEGGAYEASAANGTAGKATGALSLRRAEVVFALADLSLSVLDRPLLSRDSVHERLSRPEERGLALAFADLLIARFDPAAPLDESAFLAALEAATKHAESTLMRDADSAALLGAMASAVKCTMRTNLFIERRWALTLRLDPAFFECVLHKLPSSAGLSNRPYGVFFVAGRHFNGFHVRFSDIARGGLRVVHPPSRDAHIAESRRHFNECFRLAWAQQLKNKDIPEGGAKAVCLVYPVVGANRARLLHKCVKKFTDALLDLICPRRALSIPAPTSPTSPVVERHALSLPPSSYIAGGPPIIRSPSPDGDEDPVVSRGGCEHELLYLGPDENITPNDINWMARRAAYRGYAMPSAFISSKPEAGINHKEYGVTSEGVAVFLHEGLKAIGIDPKTQRFTVKLTGGPDGDVAGNMLRILHREYEATVRVVGIADGFGCAEDPDGIPMAELLRLADASLPISGLDAKTLGPNGALILADTREGAARRNTMHNRVVADAFVPAGGRPSTVNAGNWREFLQPDGLTPSAKLVVEGANLFFDGPARAALFEHCGLPIIKDSSANKCGVICSSMEIVASMVLDENEFKALKPRYVPQVLSRLRELARREAQMLFSEATSKPDVALPALSERISVAILRVGHALDDALDALPPAEQRALFPLVRDCILPALADDPAVRDRAASQLPWPYQRSCITSGLASRLTYREGLAFVEGLPDKGLADYARAYLRGEQRASELAAMVASAGLSCGADVEALLMKGGVRAATEGILAKAKLEAAEGEVAAAYPVQAN